MYVRKDVLIYFIKRKGDCGDGDCIRKCPFKEVKNHIKNIDLCYDRNVSYNKIIQLRFKWVVEKYVKQFNKADLLEYLI